MIIRFQTKPNKNGIIAQLEVDTEKQRFKYGSFMFVGANVTGLTKKQLNQIIDTLKYDAGFKLWFSDDAPQF